MAGASVQVPHEGRWALCRGWGCWGCCLAGTSGCSGAGGPWGCAVADGPLTRSYLVRGICGGAGHVGLPHDLASTATKRKNRTVLTHSGKRASWGSAPPVEEQGTRCSSTSSRDLGLRWKRPSLSEAPRGKARGQAAMGSLWLPGGLSGDRVIAQTRGIKTSEGPPAGRTGLWGLAPGQNIF